MRPLINELGAPQYTCVNPEQLPPYTTIIEFAEVNGGVEIRCAVLPAVKLNHTSGNVPVAKQVIALVDGEEPTIVAATVCVQVVSLLTGTDMAPAHSSLARGGGGAPTHTLKFCAGVLTRK